MVISKYSGFSGNFFLLSILALGIWCSAASASTFNTKRYQIEITSNCAEGNVVCNDVTYMSTHREYGYTLRLKGKTIHSLCADRVTPCRFLGYEFVNTWYESPHPFSGPETLVEDRYSILGDTLEIRQNGELIWSEKGIWQN